MAILKDARTTALEALIRVERKGQKPDQALEQVFGEGISDKDRGLVTELVYGVLRHRNRLDWVLGQFCRKSIRGLSPTLRNILRMGAYQILFLDRIPARAVVDEAVDLTQRKGARGLGGFVNAVLRSLDRDRASINYPDLKTDPVRYLSVFYSHPEWMVNRWLERYGPERTMALCQANNEIPPVTLRTNTLLTIRESLESQLKNEGVDVEDCVVSPLALRVKDGVATQAAAYRKGWFYIQDEAAQLVVYGLAPKPGEVILDACAAPGGKTTHMAQVMGNQGRIIALDLKAQRLELIRENCQRLGIKIVECLLGDARTVKALKNLKFDRILVDAPCSGLGVLRRNPEGKWTKTEDLVHRYARLQLEILEGVSPWLKEGGVLMYSTCSTEPEENEGVVGRFLSAHPEYRVQNLKEDLPATASSMTTPEGFFSTLLNAELMDGFFAAKLIKKIKGERK
jgi:16S rRNA (cytosine967-C5)-methyltransferase